MNDLHGDLEQLQADLADRLRVLGALFTDLGTEEGAGRLLGSLVAEDSTELNALLDNYDLSHVPRLGRCVWVREVLDSVLATTGTSDRCSLRPDLTARERLEVLALARNYQVLFVGPPGEAVISPGPFLDELKKRHLVTCLNGTTSSGPLGLLGPPTLFCV
jgi:hypothetical protein